MKRAAAVTVLVVLSMPLAAQPAVALSQAIYVDTAADTDAADGHCSLREAIIASNVGNPGYRECNAGTTGADRIYVNDDISVINVGSQLPQIVAPVEIKGHVSGSLMHLHGPGSTTALSFTSAASGSVVRNMDIENFATGISLGGNDATIAANVIGPNTDTGISVSGGTITIGGVNPRTPNACSGDCNLISGNGNYGIVGGMSGSIRGNLIGLDATGTAAQANGNGIDVGGNLTIGGVTADERNVLSGNTFFGLGLGPGCHPCTIHGNYIGTNASGTGAVPNGTGVATNGFMGNNAGFGAITVIGGTNAGEGNVISGNTAAGVLADKWGQYDSLKIQGNKIGVGASGAKLANGGDGIVLGTGPNWVVHVYIGDPHAAAASNTIAFNAGAGVRLSSQFATADYIIDNSIHDNVGKGISLLNGADDGIAAPTITGTAPVAGTACANCEVDVYSDSADEGKKYEGYAVADASGNWTFSGTPSGPHVTATALTATRGTSEFSAPASLLTRKPDARIRMGSGSFIGNNIYNTTGLNQTKSGSKAPGNTIKFGISIQNDSTAGDKFKLVATGAAVAGYKISYFRGTTNITSAVVAGTYTTSVLVPGGTVLITAKVKVTSTAAVGSSVTRLATITSVADGTKQDAVKFVVSRN